MFALMYLYRVSGNSFDSEEHIGEQDIPEYLGMVEFSW